MLPRLFQPKRLVETEVKAQTIMKGTVALDGFFDHSNQSRIEFKDFFKYFFILVQT
jgi:hypothetical protein